jgi:hypothetical protein
VAYGPEITPPGLEPMGATHQLSVLLCNRTPTGIPIRSALWSFDPSHTNVARLTKLLTQVHCASVDTPYHGGHVRINSIAALATAM